MKRGFSLVEISIVLVILGLISGGILMGQTLIRNAQLRAVATEYQRYNTAIANFVDRYGKLPGDMDDATNIWGTAAACPGTHLQGSSTPATCNGNNDGDIFYNYAGSNEMFRFWQHLANAGLVAGNFSGVTGSAGNGYSVVFGTNAPPSKLSNGGWSNFNWGSAAIPVSSPYLFEGDPYHNVLLFGAVLAGTYPDRAILTPEEAYNIDSKIDDGRPALGKARTYEALTDCHTAGTSTTVALASTANYALTYTSPACAFIFWTPADATTY